jgi:hypothetical protein
MAGAGGKVRGQHVIRPVTECVTEPHDTPLPAPHPAPPPPSRASQVYIAGGQQARLSRHASFWVRDDAVDVVDVARRVVSTRSLAPPTAASAPGNATSSSAVVSAECTGPAAAAYAATRAVHASKQP